MKVYLVVFEGAYGLQIEGAFETTTKAEEYISSLSEDLRSCYNFEIKEYEIK